VTDLEDLERTLAARLDALPAQARDLLRATLMLPDYDRAARIGDFYADKRAKTFAELLMDLEESPHARAVVLGMLRDRESG
jgi:hypothetical protein